MSATSSRLQSLRSSKGPMLKRPQAQYNIPPMPNRTFWAPLGAARATISHRRRLCCGQDHVSEAAADHAALHQQPVLQVHLRGPVGL